MTTTTEQTSTITRTIEIGRTYTINTANADFSGYERGDSFTVTRPGIGDGEWYGTNSEDQARNGRSVDYDLVWITDKHLDERWLEGDTFTFANYRDQTSPHGFEGRTGTVVTAPNPDDAATLGVHVLMDGERPDNNGTTPFFWPATRMVRTAPADADRPFTVGETVYAANAVHVDHCARQFGRATTERTPLTITNVSDPYVTVKHPDATVGDVVYAYRVTREVPEPEAVVEPTVVLEVPDNRDEHYDDMTHMEAFLEDAVRQIGNKQAEVAQARLELRQQNVKWMNEWQALGETLIELANDNNLCGVFDESVKDVNSSGRFTHDLPMREREITVYVDYTISVPITVTAADEDGAEEMVTQSEVDEAVRSATYSENGEWSVTGS